MTRLNGIPIQMLAMVTEASDQPGAVSQWAGASPIACRTALTMPESLLSIQDQVDADTISGSSQGTRNSARSVTDSRKCRVKKTASAMPMLNWSARDTTVKTTVCTSAGRKVESAKTVR